LAAVGILMIGIGGWLMYEAYKGADVTALKGKLTATAGLASKPLTPTQQTVLASSETNMLDTAAVGALA
jgi:hypothetical protein